MQRVSAATVRGGVGVATAGTGGARPRTRCAARLARGASRGEVASNAAPPPSTDTRGEDQDLRAASGLLDCHLVLEFFKVSPSGKTRGGVCGNSVSSLNSSRTYN